MAQYKITSSGVHDTISGASIPAAIGNRHWQEYKLWKAEPNTPDPSIDESEWIANERNTIKQTFSQNLMAGFVTIVNSFKFDCTPDDIQKLQMALDLANATSASSVDIRDFNNNVQNVARADLQIIVSELTANYETLLNEKWLDQAAVTGGLNYANFISAELVAHGAVVAAN